MGVGRTGFWTDRSRSPVLGATLTLPVDQGYYLLTSLTFLITLTGASFWNLTALLLHRLLVATGNTDIIGLQQRVSLLNLGSSIKVFIESIKLYHSRVGKGVPRLGLRTLRIAIPAALIWILFSAASILSSRIVISGANSDVVSPVEPNRCGLLVPTASQSALTRKGANDTILARNYVSTFYNNAPVSPLSKSHLKSVTVPIEISPSASCPFPNPDRCQLGPSSAFSMKARALNSHHELGINARLSDQVTLTYEAVCSPISRFTGDYLKVIKNDNGTSRTYTRAYFGPDPHRNETFTYQFYDETISTQAGYLVQPVYALASEKDANLIPTWIPTADFDRTNDADVTMFFLSQNGIAYEKPTLDPWFLADGKSTDQLENGDKIYFTNYLISALACIEQFTLCNPARPESSDTAKGSSCLPPTGLLALQLLLSKDSGSGIGFNTAQLLTATRILAGHMTLSTLFYSVISLRGAALWATDLVYANISPGLPENHWQAEVLGWFQTSLVKLQSSVVEFASYSEDLAGTKFLPPPMEDQCQNQLVRTTGEMQNFSFLGVVVIVCCCGVVICLDVGSGLLMRLLGSLWRRRGRNITRGGGTTEAGIGESRRSMLSVYAAARQSESVQHLLRLALRGYEGEGRWVLGRWGIPTLEGAELPAISIRYVEEEDGLVVFGRPRGEEYEL